MKKIVWVCGLIAGFITAFWAVINVNVLGESASMSLRMFIGYASMVVAFSLIYVGVKNYRDNQNGGVISFGKAMRISLLITLVASTVYVVVWLVDFYAFLPDFGKQYVDATRAQMIAKGASAADIQKAVAETQKAMQQYRNPVFNIMMTYAEIVPVGIVISLIASLLLKRNYKPTQATA